MSTTTQEPKLVLERTYIVPLKGAWNSAYHKRTKRAVRILKEFASHHMKTEIDLVVIDPYLNRLLWSRGNANPPRKVKVLMKKYDDGKVEVFDYENYFASLSKSRDESVKDDQKGVEKSDEGKDEKAKESSNNTSKEDQSKTTKEDKKSKEEKGKTKISSKQG